MQDGAGPLRGALFDQVVKEFRSEYAAAVTACAQRIHGALAENRHSIRVALERFGVNGQPGVMQEQVTCPYRVFAYLWLVNSRRTF